MLNSFAAPVLISFIILVVGCLFRAILQAHRESNSRKEMNDEIQNMLNYQEQILNARREQLQELIAEQHRFDGAED